MRHFQASNFPESWGVGPMQPLPFPGNPSSSIWLNRAFAPSGPSSLSAPRMPSCPALHALPCGPCGMDVPFPYPCPHTCYLENPLISFLTVHFLKVFICNNFRFTEKLLREVWHTFHPPSPHANILPRPHIRTKKSAPGQYYRLSCTLQSALPSLPMNVLRCFQIPPRIPRCLLPLFSVVMAP